ncbi:MAG: DHH family phosphoesterase [Clostridia bacterium]|nr:DHH family phosphoesterase [Clostridia bacterium]
MSPKNKHEKKPLIFSRRVMIVVVVAALFFVLYGLLMHYSELNTLALGGVLLVCLLAAEFIALKLYGFFSFRMADPDDEKLSPLLGNITLDFILKLYLPVVICDESGRIIWYNNAFTGAANPREVLYAKYIDSVVDVTIDRILEDTTTPPENTASSDGVEAVAYDRVFRIKGYKITSQGKNYVITVWNERTELKQMAKRLADEETIIAYVMIDNLDELMQFVQEKYRAAAAQVEAILKEWADSVGGILKEYERDKFIFLFEARYLDEFIEKKFDVLDRIREVRIGEGSMPVTVSIGISRVKGTLADKDRDAHASLDLALQRGGDQVVVKNIHNTEFYGGRTKTVQKRTKVRARVIANQLSLCMAKANNVLIMGHRNPDYDSIGACVGIARLAMFCGVKANIVVNREDPNIKSAITRVAPLPEYADIFVDSITGQDMIHSDTLLVIVDVNNPVQFEAPDIAENVGMVAIIDHHRKTGDYKREPAISYIEPSASSACELVSEMLEQALPIGGLHREEADVLYAGMLLDTKQFSRNTGVRTFSAALYLRSEGANPTEVQWFFKSGLEDFMREAKFSMNVVTYRQMFAISMSDSDGTPQDRVAAAKAADKLLSVSGVMASFALVQIEDSVHISARSAGNINVQLILERMGGGGYYEAAGAFLKDVSMTSALTSLKDAIDDYMKKN